MVIQVCQNNYETCANRIIHCLSIYNRNLYFWIFPNFGIFLPERIKIRTYYGVEATIVLFISSCDIVPGGYLTCFGCCLKNCLAFYRCFSLFCGREHLRILKLVLRWDRRLPLLSRSAEAPHSPNPVFRPVSTVRYGRPALRGRGMSTRILILTGISSPVLPAGPWPLPSRQRTWGMIMTGRSSM